ncbi:YolD-like family protein [Bacillus sp. MUM 13]|uniref:YolD-like family protein n=1 Tax=Bacillus sp. MUM 13 TaxID=1678001 RepID=UPI0008F5CD47|nr:YolD-like family protein [Bacillus sp. MUM 13]OIK13523.1 hypothetical protein BIV59_05490 [Bacillus sp. MUM 13]
MNITVRKLAGCPERKSTGKLTETKDKEQMKMIKDNIKWTSLMLPEHIRLLRQLIEENKLEKKPFLDGKNMEQIGQAAMDSLNLTIPVRTIYWKDGLFDTKIGIVADVDMLNREIIVDLLSGSISIPIDHLVAIERV